MYVCSCGKRIKNKGGLMGHARGKHPDETVSEVVARATWEDPEPVPEPESEPEPAMDAEPQVPAVNGAPAILDEWNTQVGRVKPSVVGREITMLRPICATCQRGKSTPARWWVNCTHNPYITVAEVEKTEPKYETGEDGRVRLVGTETFVTWEERPNRVQVSVNKRINSGVMVEKKRRRAGFIFPEELRSPTYPNGIANTCEYRDCFVQVGLKNYRWGRFCREVEAQLVGHDTRMDGGGGALEIGDTGQSMEKQRMQLESVPL